MNSCTALHCQYPDFWDWTQTSKCKPIANACNLWILVHGKLTALIRWVWRDAFPAPWIWLHKTLNCLHYFGVNSLLLLSTQAVIALLFTDWSTAWYKSSKYSKHSTRWSKTWRAMQRICWGIKLSEWTDVLKLAEDLGAMAKGDRDREEGLKFNVFEVEDILRCQCSNVAGTTEQCRSRS